MRRLFLLRKLKREFSLSSAKARRGGGMPLGFRCRGIRRKVAAGCMTHVHVCEFRGMWVGAIIILRAHKTSQFKKNAQLRESGSLAIARRRHGEVTLGTG